MYHLKYKSTISRAIYAIKQIIIPTKNTVFKIKKYLFRETKPKNVQDKIDSNFPAILTLVTYVGANGVHVA